MAFPKPQLGLVLSYAYLWHREHKSGRSEGVKDRPCVIVLALEQRGDGTTLVRVVPVTHSRPTNAEAAYELPPAVKNHLGLDHERSWIVLDEVNEFVWPGFDLRTVPSTRDSYAYGFLPPRLFNRLMVQMRQVWKTGQGRATPRD